MVGGNCKGGSSSNYLSCKYVAYQRVNMTNKLNLKSLCVIGERYSNCGNCFELKLTKYLLSRR